jgi:hypothetical protein
VDPNAFTRVEWIALVPGIVELEHAEGPTVLARAIAFWEADLDKYGGPTSGAVGASSAREALKALRAIDSADPRLR